MRNHQRKFQLKMVLSILIQIPCHHVLGNEIDLNLKYHIGIKHFFNINLGIGIIKKTTFFVCIFDISPCVFTQIISERDRWMRIKSLDAEFNSTSNEYPHCITLTDPATPKTRNTWKKHDDDIIITLFQVFLIFGIAWSIKSMQCGYSLDAESNSTSKELSQSKFE